MILTNIKQTDKQENKLDSWLTNESFKITIYLVNTTDDEATIYYFQVFQTL